MKVGDFIEEDVLSAGETSYARRKGQVVYIHPKNRFYTVEFRGKHGEPIRECFVKKESKRPPLLGRPCKGETKWK